jgi:methylglutaconyl-CoA hydratase
MTQELLIQEVVAKGVFSLTLNRSEKRNALNIALLDRFRAAVEELESLPDSRIVILKGAGSVFCAGLDLDEASHPELAHHSGESIAAALRVLWNSPLISVAAVQGAALGGGAGLAAACDFVIAAEGTRWAFPEVRRGLVPALVSVILGRQVGRRQAMEWLLTGDVLDPLRLLNAGIVNRVVPPERLEHNVLELVKALLAGAPQAQRRTKRLLEKLSGPALEEQLELASAVHLEARTSTEAEEGVHAFLEKRPPNW